MLGRIAYDAAKWQTKAYKKSRAQKGGPVTFLSLVFAVVPMLALWPFADMLTGRAVPWYTWITPAVLALLGGAVATDRIAHGSTASRRLARYDRLARTDPTTTPAFWQERAGLIEELEEQRRIMTGRNVSPDTSPVPRPQLPDTRVRRVAGLLATECPLGECGAEVGTGCQLRPMGRRFAIVRLKPLLYCHVERMAAAVLNGTADPELVLAQFDNQVNVPEDLLKIIEGARKDSNDDRDDQAQPAEAEPSARSPRT